MRKASNISLSVYHIIHFAELIEKTFSTYKFLLKSIFKGNNNEEERKIVYLNVGSQLLIYTNSLKDEYTKYFIVKLTKNDEEKEKVKQLREMLKPVFKKIEQWNDIENFRNYVLAHNLRIREKGYLSIFEVHGLSGYNIPEKGQDFEFLVSCTNLIKKSIYRVFKQEYDEVEKMIDTDDHTDKAYLPERNYNQEYKDLITELISIKKKIESRFQS